MSKPYSVHRKARNMGDAVRLFCLECQGSSEEFGNEFAAVRNCPDEDMCSLWPYRFGKSPRRSESAKKRMEDGTLRPPIPKTVEGEAEKVPRTRRKVEKVAQLVP